MAAYYFEEWYNEVKSVLPEDVRREVETQFDEMTHKKLDSLSFVTLFSKFIDKRVGKSASNPVSVKVYSKMTGFSEDQVRDIFFHRGLE